MFCFFSFTEKSTAHAEEAGIYERRVNSTWSTALENSIPIDFRLNKMPGYRPPLCPKPAPPPPMEIKQTKETAPESPFRVNFTADELKQSGALTRARGKVNIDFRDYRIKADKIEFNKISGEIEATGNVEVEKGNDSVSGDSLLLNINTNKAEMLNGYGVSKDAVARGETTTDVFFWGEKIILDKVIYVRNGTFTTCDEPRPDYHYHITGNDIVIIPKDKIIIRKARFFKNNSQIFGINTLRIPLKKKSVLPFIPKIGRNSLEGEYIKEPIMYDFGENQSGTLNIDYYRKTGLGGGIEHGYNFADQGAGRFRAYSMGSPLKDRQRYIISNKAYYKFPGDYFLSANYTSERYQYPGIPVSDNKNADLFFSRNTDQVYYGLLIRNYIINDDRNNGVNFKTKVRINERMHSDFVVDYVVSDTKNDHLYKLNTLGRLVREGDIFDTWLIVDNTWSNKDFYINRLPEVSLRSHAFGMGPFKAKVDLGAGSYTEMPSNVNAMRSDLKFSLLNKVFDIGNHGNLAFAAGGRQLVYGTGEKKYQVKSQLALEERLGKNISLIASHNYQKNNGFSPLAMDYFENYHILASTLELHDNKKEKIRLQLTGGYDLDRQIYQTFIPRLEYCPSKSFKFLAGSTYDYNNKLWMNIDGEIGVKVSKNWSLKYWGLYDMINKKMTYQNYVVEYDSHDFITRLIYKGAQGELWIDMNLKFLSPTGPEVGPNPQLPVINNEMYDGAPEEGSL